jgi:hypothetical protein
VFAGFALDRQLSDGVLEYLLDDQMQSRACEPPALAADR